MQKVFIVKEAISSRNENGNYSKVNEFIGGKGHIVSVTRFGIASSSGGQCSMNNDRIAGRVLVVADDGKGENINL